MARVTVEDCVEKVPNRFDLVMLAAQRSRDLSIGAPLNVERDNDKNPVVALREIAEGKLDHGDLEESLVKGLQKVAEPDEPEDEAGETPAHALAPETVMGDTVGDAAAVEAEELAGMPRFEDIAADDLKD